MSFIIIIIGIIALIVDREKIIKIVIDLEIINIGIILLYIKVSENLENKNIKVIIIYIILLTAIETTLILTLIIVIKREIPEYKIFKSSTGGGRSRGELNSYK